jgi:zinc transport system substrate-binding protein
MKKRFFCCLLALFLCVGCSSPQADREDGKLQIIATLFPQYDFARILAGDRAQITLLLPPGVESHTFEPTPAQMVQIQQADLFLYTGEAMEPWAATLSKDLREGQVLDVCRGIALQEHGQEEEHDGHAHTLDPHVWTSPLLAKEMVQNICDGLCSVDPDGASLYQANASAYLTQLDQLDADFRQAVEQGQRREIVHGGRFALYYWAKEYGIEYLAAFDSCSGETEPSAQAVAQIVDKIRQDGLPVIYYEELSDPKVARSVSQETGAQMLLLHSCHNVSKEDLESGATYLSLMEQNLENLRKGLN